MPRTTSRFTWATRPGGAYDVFARTIAPYLGRYLPGNPNVIVVNLPGAGSINLVNQLDAVLPADGTAIGTFSRSLVVDKVIGRSGTETLNLAEFNWLGSASEEVSVCAVWHTVGIETTEDFLTRDLILGAVAPGTETAIYAELLNEYAGANLELVMGYPGTNEMDLAIERGEIDGRCGWTWGSMRAGRADWIEQGLIKVVMQFAREPHPDLTHVPLASEFIESEAHRQALELILSQQVMGRPYAAPPGVPGDRMDALHAAFAATMDDPDFRASVERQGLEVLPTLGAELQDLAHSILNAPPEIVEEARQVLLATE